MVGKFCFASPSPFVVVVVKFGSTVEDSGIASPVTLLEPEDLALAIASPSPDDDRSPCSDAGAAGIVSRPTVEEVACAATEFPFSGLADCLVLDKLNE